MSFEQLTAAFAERKSLLEESWLGDKSIFSDVYYKYVVDGIKDYKGIIDGFLGTNAFEKSSYAEMKKMLEGIETTCYQMPGWKDLGDTVHRIRTALEDFPTIKRLYETYLTSTINDIINNVGTGE